MYFNSLESRLENPCFFSFSIHCGKGKSRNSRHIDKHIDKHVPGLIWHLSLVLDSHMSIWDGREASPSCSHISQLPPRWQICCINPLIYTPCYNSRVWGQHKHLETMTGCTLELKASSSHFWQGALLADNHLSTHNKHRRTKVLSCPCGLFLLWARAPSLRRPKAEI